MRIINGLSLWVIYPLIVFNGDRVSFTKTYVRKKTLAAQKKEEAEKRQLSLGQLCKYTEQLAKGEINDIYFDNIQVLNGDIPVSVIRGYQTPTEEVRVHDVHFDNITFMGNKCETWQDMRLVTELANDIYVNGVRTCRQMKF